MELFTTLLLFLVTCSAVVADYGDDALSAIKTLQEKFYNSDTGLWYVFIDLTTFSLFLAIVKHVLGTIFGGSLEISSK